VEVNDKELGRKIGLSIWKLARFWGKWSDDQNKALPLGVFLDFYLGFLRLHVSVLCYIFEYLSDRIGTF